MIIRTDDQTVQIRVYYKEINAVQCEACTEKVFAEKRLPPLMAAEYSTLTVTMRAMKWGRYNDLQESATITEHNGNRKFVYKKFKEEKMKSLLVAWDAKDDDGNDLPVTPENILGLDEKIAETILAAYDEGSFVTDEEEKKS